MSIISGSGSSDILQVKSNLTRFLSEPGFAIYIKEILGTDISASQCLLIPESFKGSEIVAWFKEQGLTEDDYWYSNTLGSEGFKFTAYFIRDPKMFLLFKLAWG